MKQETKDEIVGILGLIVASVLLAVAISVGYLIII